MKEHQIYKMYEDLYAKLVLSYMEVAEHVVIVRGHKLTTTHLTFTCQSMVRRPTL